MTGVRVNEFAETAVSGLYAAGDTSLVARGHLSGAFVYGEIAAESASRYASKSAPVEVDADQVAAFIEDRDRRFERSGNKISIEEFEYKVRRIINDYIVPPKNEYKLDRALWWMDRFRKEIRELVFVRDVHDLFKTYEVENIIQCATMSALASRERRESRWGPWHQRTDFPEKDDSNWMKHIALTQGEAPEDVRISYRDIVRMGGREGKEKVI